MNENILVYPINDTAICPVCGIEFVKKTHNQKYCSMSCHWKQNEKRKLETGYYHLPNTKRLVKIQNQKKYKKHIQNNLCPRCGHIKDGETTITCICCSSSQFRGELNYAKNSLRTSQIV